MNQGPDQNDRIGPEGRKIMVREIAFDDLAANVLSCHFRKRRRPLEAALGLISILMVSDSIQTF
jgi:hypothetical protein